MRPPAQAPRIRLRRPASARALKAPQRYSFEIFHGGIESILNEEHRNLSFEYIYRAGYNLNLSSDQEVLYDLMQIACKALRRMRPDKIELARTMIHDVNMFCEHTWVRKHNMTSVKDMGRLCLP